MAEHFDRPGGEEDAALPHFSPGVQGRAGEIDQVVERHRADLLRTEGVVGVAIGQHVTGDPAVIVYVDRHLAPQSVPQQVEGYPVRMEVVPGGFEAQ